MAQGTDQDMQETVVVTGGSGFIGNWTVVALLKAGYKVRATIRSMAGEGAVRKAIAREVDAGDRMSFWPANLTQDAGWAAAVESADYVLHVASPMPTGEYKKTKLVVAAREGTRRVLQASAAAGVKRVVITSSAAAATPDAKMEPGRVIDETVWTDLSNKALDEYSRSKTLAERDAWEWMRTSGGAMTLTTILPTSVQGPLLTPDLFGSIELLGRMLTGKMPYYPRIGFNMVDVRDLADLHLRAMTSPQAAGERFIGTSDFLWFSEVATMLRERFGERAAKVPTKALPDWVVRILGHVSADVRFVVPMLGRRTNYSSAKAMALLGWHTRPASEAVMVAAQGLFDDRLL